MTHRNTIITSKASSAQGAHLDGGEVVAGLPQDVGVTRSANYHGGYVRNRISSGVSSTTGGLFGGGSNREQTRPHGSQHLLRQKKVCTNKRVVYRRR